MQSLQAEFKNNPPMSDGQNIPQKNRQEQIPNSETDNDNKIISQQFPEDTHAPKASQPEIINDKPETETMEVHKHPHHVMHKKKWGEYLLEFAMLFLAVFLGFLAENWREHIIESNREQQYIQSFYEDLTADERDLEININNLRTQIRQADSLQLLMKNITTKQPANLIYIYLRLIVRSSASLLFPNDRTIVQLRNAGGMRLIKNKSVSDSMVGYYRTAQIIQFLTEDGLITRRSLREKSVPLLNAEDFSKIVDSTSLTINPAETIFLRKADPDIINDCLIEINRIKAINGTLSIRIQGLKEKAGRIKDFINREYHLKNE